MATPVIMPRQGQSVESCVITEWKKKVGDKVNLEGDIVGKYIVQSAPSKTGLTEASLTAAGFI